MEKTNVVRAFPNLVPGFSPASAPADNSRPAHALYTLAHMQAPSTAAARFQPSSDNSLLVYFDRPHQQGTGAETPQNKISAEANENVRRLLQLLQSKPIAGVRNLHPAYCSLLVKFDPQKWRHEELEEKLREYLERITEVQLPEARLLEIPVCYGGGLGPALND